MGRVLYWIAFIPLCIIVIVFAVSNHGTTDLSLWPVLTEPVPFPVYGIALIALFIGFLLGGIVSWFQGGSARRRVRSLQRQAESEQREIAGLRERLDRLDVADRQATIPPAPPPAPLPPPAAVAGPAAAAMPGASATER